MRTVLITCIFAALGCTSDAGTTLLVTKNTVPGNNCVIEVSTSTFIARGRIDVNAESGYLFTPEVQNIATSAMGDPERIVIVEGANVDLEFSGSLSAADFDAGLVSFSVGFAGPVEPNGGTSTFAFDIIPYQLLVDLRDELGAGNRTLVTAKVSVFGTLEGGDVESNTFSYPVDVCNGCLKSVVGECAALPTGFQAQTGGICQPLQDGFLECCTNNGVEICPAIALEPDPA